MSEIFRAGIQSVSKGQREAAYRFRHDAKSNDAPHRPATGAAHCDPPVGNEFIAMLKDSSLVSATGFVTRHPVARTESGPIEFPFP